MNGCKQTGKISRFFFKILLSITMTQSGVAPRCASAPPHCHPVLHREVHPLAGDERFVEEMPGRSHGAAALAVGGSEFARRVVEQRRKRLEARAGWLATRMCELWNPPALTRQE